MSEIQFSNLSHLHFMLSNPHLVDEEVDEGDLATVIAKDGNPELRNARFYFESIAGMPFPIVEAECFFAVRGNYYNAQTVFSLAQDIDFRKISRGLSRKLRDRWVPGVRAGAVYDKPQERVASFAVEKTDDINLYVYLGCAEPRPRFLGGHEQFEAEVVEYQNLVTLVANTCVDLADMGKKRIPQTRLRAKEKTHIFTL